MGNVPSEPPQSSAAFTQSDREFSFFPGGVVDPEFAAVISVYASDEDDEPGLLVFACSPSMAVGRSGRVTLTADYAQGLVEGLTSWLERRRRLTAA